MKAYQWTKGRRFFILFWGVCCLILGGCGGTSAGRNGRSILPEHVSLKVGDVVFRLGSGAMSYAVRFVDRGGAYSHVGIVVDSAGQKMIVHAVPGEPDFEGDPDRVKMDAPARFFSAANAIAGEICRPVDDEVGRRAAAAATEYYRCRTLFDHQYDAGDSSKMYCTELIVRAFRAAGEQLVGAPAHEFHLPGVHTICWLPSDIHKSAFLKSISIF